MKFTIDAYKRLVRRIIEVGYQLADYEDYSACIHPCILRHDVDMDLQIAEDFAVAEAEAGIKSTYFILLSSDFYNIFSKANQKSILHILQMGHAVGLHFDEEKYEEQLGRYDGDIARIQKIKEYIVTEARILETVTQRAVNSVSMHRPSRGMLEADICIDGLINSYGKRFFEDFKYVSDSRMCWRENIDEIVYSKKYDALHILTHPIWYSVEEISLKQHLYSMIQRGPIKTYHTLHDNFRDLDEFISEEDFLCRLQKF